MTAHKSQHVCSTPAQIGDLVVFHYRISALTHDRSKLETIEDSFEIDKPLSVVLGKQQTQFKEIEEKIKLLAVGDSTEFETEKDGIKYSIQLQLLKIIKRNNNVNTDWDMNETELHNLALSKKEEGNIFFSQGKNISASRCYRKGIKQLRKIDKSKWDDENRKIRDLLITLFNNLLTCEMKLKRYGNVVKFSTECIENIGANVKSYFKRAEAYMNDGNFSLAIQDFKQAQHLLSTINPNDDITIISKIITGSPKTNINDSADMSKKMLNLIESEMNKCRRMETEYNQNMKNMFKNIFQ
ncbi:hypothetical protein C9374_008610 [Naegleria lovaniensis]|uniref:peptidylprolyl isomerase n=1 Tax=Naegleria lovaniensis TaxID=51637 RepID=A0AA88GG94_NAELO|nr:uncharacterized protein C9374_008610 [Naegleria lovaniensis]KAG2377988.1 hypothetical protein C9374_008610 [Naegleria lovaniensis]